MRHGTSMECIKLICRGLKNPLFYCGTSSEAGLDLPDGWTGKDIGMKKIRFIVEAAVIAAMYAALTIAIPGGSGQIQVRVSEALTVLAFFTPAAVPGLFVGCMAANIFVGAGPYDIVFGSLATLLAAWLTRKMPVKYLAPLPPVIINAVVVAFVLKLTANLPILVTMGFVALGEVIACYGLGYPLLLLLEKQRGKIFKR